jgi:hypothetical protein
MMIGMGIILRGPEDMPVDGFLTSAMKAVKVARGEWKEGEIPAVIVVWVVPGSLGKVNFTGQRVTLFSKKKKLLQIEAAVPQEVVDAGGSVEFVVDALRTACATAADVFARKGIKPFDLSKAETIVEKVDEILSSKEKSEHDN